jgi:hypothetical protein
MTEPEKDKKTGEAHDIHGSPKPGDTRGAKIGDQGGDYYRTDKIDSDKETDVSEIKEHADHETNDEAAIGLTEEKKETRSKGVGFEEESDARTHGLISTTL